MVKNPFRKRWTVFERAYRGYNVDSDREMPLSRRWTWKAAVRRSTWWWRWSRTAYSLHDRVEVARSYVVRRLP